MRRKISAGVLMALALLIPAAPAAAQTESRSLDASCQTAERKVYKDIRELVTIDLDTATDEQLQVLATQILTAAKADSLVVLPPAITEQLKGAAEGLRTFLKSGMERAWTVDLRILVLRTLTDAGANVKAATQKVLDEGDVDAYLVYLNDGLYAARKLDCASKPTPSATTTAAPAPTSSASQGTGGPGGTPSAGISDTPGGEGGGADNGDDGGLPVTGADAAAMAGVGGALLVLGGAGYLVARRRRSRFVP